MQPGESLLHRADAAVHPGGPLDPGKGSEEGCLSTFKYLHASFVIFTRDDFIAIQYVVHVATPMGKVDGGRIKIDLRTDLVFFISFFISFSRCTSMCAEY